jgi:CarboxypepD_reg-like domain/TonB-dependent Receptor Plug Domain
MTLCAFFKKYMMLMKCRLALLFSFLFVLTHFRVHAQVPAAKLVLTGVVKNANGELLDGASISYTKAAKKKGTVTDKDGEFSLSVGIGSYTFEISCLGYETKQVTVDITNSKFLEIVLTNQSNELREVVVNSDRTQPKKKLETTQMSTELVTMKEAKLLPAIFGEIDIIKTLQLKPGIKSGGEGTAGLFVRGGGTDQNLILLEGAPVYNPNHLLGFFSVFNQDAIKEVEVYKGGFPAQYGGRISSVLDVTMTEGRKDKIRVQGGIGLIASRLSVDGGIAKKHSFILSAKFVFDLGVKDKLIASAYYGKDFFTDERINFASVAQWGNVATSLNWQHKFTDAIQVNTRAIYAGYQYRINNRFGANGVSLGSNIYDVGLKSDISYRLNDKHDFKAGLQFFHHDFVVNQIGINTTFTDLSSGQTLGSNEVAAFVQHDYEVSAKLKINYGFRYSGFLTDGSYFNGFEPRFALRYKINDDNVVKLNYSNMFQYLHLVTTTGAALPTDVWYPSTKNVAPQNGQQVGCGYNRSFKNTYFFSFETYYKWINNAVDLKDGANVFLNNNIETEFVSGKQESYGFEVYAEKKKGRTTGWIGYTLAWSWRNFDNVNNNNRFRPLNDRRHEISAVVIHKLNERMTLSATWVFSSGTPISVPQGRYAFQDNVGQTPRLIPVFTDRGNYEIPPNHRLDIGLTLRKKKKWGEREWVFSLYNAYSRLNPIFLRLLPVRDAQNNPINFTPELVSLFPILPAIAYNLKFK